jgi:hypothetical protein
LECRLGGTSTGIKFSEKLVLRRKKQQPFIIDHRAPPWVEYSPNSLV